MDHQVVTTDRESWETEEKLKKKLLNFQKHSKFNDTKQKQKQEQKQANKNKQKTPETKQKQKTQNQQKTTKTITTTNENLHIFSSPFFKTCD